MRRKIFLSMSMILVVLMVSQASAKIRSFGHFRVDVPSGWSGELQGQTLIVKSERVNASVAVAFAETGGASFTDIVERLYTQMDGDNLEQDSDGDYTFTFTNLAGGQSFAIITAGDGCYLVLSVTGYDIEEVQADIEAILDSVDFEE